MLSVHRGFDFARILISLDEGGYNAEWRVINSKDYGVPQNRERVFIVGHFRGKGGQEVLPKQKDNREATELQGQQGAIANTLRAGDRNTNGCYLIDGGGGAESEWISQGVNVGNKTNPKITDIATTLNATDYKGYRNQVRTAVIVNEE